MKGGGDISLRDWYAGMALSGMLANPTIFGVEDKDDKQKEVSLALSAKAFEFADQMMRQHRIAATLH